MTERPKQRDGCLHEHLPGVLLAGLGVALGASVALQMNLLTLLILGLPFALMLVRLSTSEWVLVTLLLAVFSRLIQQAGLSSVVNFLHFALALMAFIRALGRSKTGNSVAGSEKLAVAAVGMLAIYLLSALANRSGVLAPLLGWVIITEPFILVYAILKDPPIGKGRSTFAWILLALAAVQVPVAIAQAALYGISDHVRGTFIGAGAGAHVVGSMTLVAGVFALSSGLVNSRSARLILFSSLFLVSVLADAKQVIGALVLALVIAACFGSARMMIRSLGAAIAVVGLVYVAAEFYPTLRMLTDLSLITRGLQNKLAGIPLLLSEFHSAIQWVFGAGPGKTISRLSLMGFQDYGGTDPIVQLFGIKPSAITQLLWDANYGSFLSGSKGSSAWSMIFSWLGIAGDVGLAGLAVYVFMGWHIWRAGTQLTPAHAHFVRFALILVAILGAIFTYMEEPGIMLYVAATVGFLLTERDEKSLLPIEGVYAERG